MAQQTPKSLQCGRAFVKSVTSGDQIIVRGQPRGGPPKEKVIIFSNLDAGKAAKRANPNGINPTQETGDAEYAWTARENLRKKVIGREVFFKVEDMTTRNCSFGVVYLGTDETGENLTEWSVSTGNCKLRDTVKKQLDQARSREAAQEAKGETAEPNTQADALQKLVDLEEKAKNEKAGRWVDGGIPQRANIKWSISNPDHFLEANQKKPLPAILEHVFNASMVRLYLVSENAYVTLSLTGIRAPTERGGGGNEEEFFALAKYTVESKLLNKDLHVCIEGVAPNLGGNKEQKEPLFVGTLQHPAGNISELLLKEGFAKCVDWSMGMLSGDASKYRNAEKSAKMIKKRLWRNWEPADANIPESERDFSGKVVQIINSDSLSINDGTTTKQIFMSSIRPARASDLSEDLQKKAAKAHDPKSKALYTVPYLFEAREFLRKKLIGKKVHVKVDYKRPASNENGKDYPERLCATVTYQAQNIAEALVAKGVAVPIKHRHDDDNRSSKYDDLREAEKNAIKALKGIHAKTLPDAMRVADVSQEIPKARAFMPFLKGKKNDAVVDYVFSGSRLKLYIPKETCLITFLIGGIECPRGERPNRDGGKFPADPFSTEAADLTRELAQQRDVVVEVETMDKVGGFVGYIFVDKVNVSVKLVEAGLSKVHYSGEQGKYANELLAAQDRAQKAGLNMWAGWSPPKEEKVIMTNGKATEVTSRTVNLKKICITEVTNNMCFYGQYTANSQKLEELTSNMRGHFAENEPTPGVYKAKRNDICAAIFPEDSLWYRGKVEKIARDGSDTATITFIDYGNRAQVPITKLASLPAQFSCAVLAGQANEFQLALVKPPVDEDSLNIALDQFISMLGDDSYSVNDENMKEGNTYQVTLMTKDGLDIGEDLLKSGFCTTVKKSPKHLSELHSKYLEVQAQAKKQHLNLWRYGDITEDDDNEFGMNNEKAKN